MSIENAFDILQPNTTFLVALNVEMIRDQVLQDRDGQTSQSNLDFASGVVKFIPIYPMGEVLIGDWVVLHEGSAVNVPLDIPASDSVYVVRGFEVLGNDARQVLVCTPLI